MTLLFRLGLLSAAAPRGPRCLKINDAFISAGPAVRCLATSPPLSLRPCTRVFGAAAAGAPLPETEATSTAEAVARAAAGPLMVAQLPCLSDNYGYLIHDPGSGDTAAVDTPDAAPYLAELAARGWVLTHILNTHHHHDHTGGNEELLAAFPAAVVVGPEGEAAKIPGLARGVGGGDVVALGGQEARVIDVGGHTLGHVAYYFAGAGLAFVGDSLFSLGCGRLFEVVRCIL